MTHHTSKGTVFISLYSSTGKDSCAGTAVDTERYWPPVTY